MKYSKYYIPLSFHSSPSKTGQPPISRNKYINGYFPRSSILAILIIDILLLLHL